MDVRQIPAAGTVCGDVGVGNIQRDAMFVTLPPTPTEHTREVTRLHRGREGRERGEGEGERGEGEGRGGGERGGGGEGDSQIS